MTEDACFLQKKSKNSSMACLRTFFLYSSEKYKDTVIKEIMPHTYFLSLRPTAEEISKYFRSCASSRRLSVFS